MQLFMGLEGHQQHDSSNGLVVSPHLSVQLQQQQQQRVQRKQTLLPLGSTEIRALAVDEPSRKHVDALHIHANTSHWEMRGCRHRHRRVHEEAAKERMRAAIHTPLPPLLLLRAARGGTAPRRRAFVQRRRPAWKKAAATSAHTCSTSMTQLSSPSVLF